MINLVNSPTRTSRQLRALTRLVTASSRKAKTSLTLSGNLLKVIDALAGERERSAWVERAVRAYAARQLRHERRARELELLNRHAKALNGEGDDSATYQSSWDAE
jgi:mRNA-degrading endonuclease toxin of MazEF toxin-antitoxin module